MTPTTPSERHDVTRYSGPTLLLALDTNVFTLETGSLTKGYVIPKYCANNGNITSIESAQGDIVCAVTESGKVLHSPNLELPGLENYKIKRVAYNSSKFYFVTCDGLLFTYNSTKGKISGELTRVPLTNINDVLYGYEHLYYISGTKLVNSHKKDTNDFYYGSTKNDYCQAATRDKNLPENYKMVALDQYKRQIKKISVGGWHNMVLLHSNKVIAWGYNKDSRCCGTSNKSSPHIADPIVVPFEFDVLDVSAGQWHTIVLSTSREVYAWGLTYGSALGKVGRVGKSVTVPRKVVGISGVERLFCSPRGNRNIVRTTNGDYYTWGNDSNSSVFVDGMYVDEGTVKKVQGMEGVTDIKMTSAGLYFYFVSKPKTLVRRVHQFSDVAFKYV